MSLMRKPFARKLVGRNVVPARQILGVERQRGLLPLLRRQAFQELVRRGRHVGGRTLGGDEPAGEAGERQAAGAPPSRVSFKWLIPTSFLRRKPNIFREPGARYTPAPWRLRPPAPATSSSSFAVPLAVITYIDRVAISVVRAVHPHRISA